MRRNRRGSPARPAARFVRPAIPSALSVALLVCTPGLATADPQTDTIAALIADVAKANQRLQDLSDEVQAEQESVNKAMVDVKPLGTTLPRPKTTWRSASARLRTPTRRSPRLSTGSTPSRRPPT